MAEAAGLSADRQNLLEHLEAERASKAETEKVVAKQSLEIVRLRDTAALLQEHLALYLETKSLNAEKELQSSIALEKQHKRAEATAMALADKETEIATATEELSLRLAPADRSERDFSEHGTTPWDGRVQPNSPILVRVHGRLESSFEPSADATPTRYSLVVHLSDGQTIEVTGPLDAPWPTG